MKHLGPPPATLSEMDLIHHSENSPQHSDKKVIEFKGFKALDIKSMRMRTEMMDKIEAQREKMQEQHARRTGNMGTGALGSSKPKSGGFLKGLAAGAVAITAARAAAARAEQNRGPDPQQTGPDGPGTV